MPNPLIGVTLSRDVTKSQFQLHNLSDSYVQAVRSAGGIPVLIPVGQSPEDWPALRAHLGGVLFTGGGDIDPVLFHGQPHPRVYEVDEGRDTLELGLARLAAESGWPFLGICRGIQVINVALGGTLYTDIQDQHPAHLKHDFYPDIPRNYLAHSVEVAAGSKLAAVVAPGKLEVNSLHHQGLDQLAPGLRAVAHSADPLVEAVELEGHPFGMGVQWHPEWLQEHASMRALMRAFVDACR